MITLIQHGKYKLIETGGQKKMLILDKHVYTWKDGVLFVASHRSRKNNVLSSIRSYRMYGVKDEPKFTDAVHLELFLGKGVWRGYLLPEGLPAKTRQENGIIQTAETITKTTH